MENMPNALAKNLPNYVVQITLQEHVLMAKTENVKALSDWFTTY